MLTVIFLLAKCLIVAGALILICALVPVSQLIGRLPVGTLRNRWYAMTALIVLFILGYLGYVIVSWNQNSHLIDLLVPAVFFAGACFVWLTAILSLQTAMDVMRISLLERETFTDPLTGVFNRRYLDRRLTEEFATASRYGLPLSVLLLDLDHFKQINDEHGHQIGDQVLIAAGKIIASELRASDILARYGGEEFLVIAPHTALLKAAEQAERLRKRIEDHDFRLQTESGKVVRLRLTISIGVASYGDGIDNVDRLVHAADENLYRAKREGRNRVVAAAPIL